MDVHPGVFLGYGEAGFSLRARHYWKLKYFAAAPATATLLPNGFYA
jgi:hypothetical protein